MWLRDDSSKSPFGISSEVLNLNRIRLQIVWRIFSLRLLSFSIGWIEFVNILNEFGYLWRNQVVGRLPAPIDWSVSNIKLNRSMAMESIVWTLFGSDLFQRIFHVRFLSDFGWFENISFENLMTVLWWFWSDWVTLTVTDSDSVRSTSHIEPSPNGSPWITWHPSDSVEVIRPIGILAIQAKCPQKPQPNAIPNNNWITAEFAYGNVDENRTGANRMVYREQYRSTVAHDLCKIIFILFVIGFYVLCYFCFVSLSLFPVFFLLF